MEAMFPVKPNTNTQILGSHIQTYIASGFCNCAERISFFLFLNEKANYPRLDF